MLSILSGRAVISPTTTTSFVDNGIAIAPSISCEINDAPFIPSSPPPISLFIYFIFLYFFYSILFYIFIFLFILYI